MMAHSFLNFLHLILSSSVNKALLFHFTEVQELRPGK